MNEQIDWSKAPEGATHHKAEDSSVFELWLKPGYAVRVSRGSPDWVRSDCADKLIADGATARPTTPSWSGEGVPAVGATLESTDKTLNDGAWTKVVILAVGKHGKDDCVLMAEVLDDKGTPGTMVASLYTQYEDCFRPLRTPEQIAADEQETATDVMFARFGGVAGLTRKQCAWVISEGYRKP